MFFCLHSKKSEELMIGIMDPATRLDFTASGCFKWKATTNLGEFLTLSSNSHVASSTGYPFHRIRYCNCPRYSLLDSSSSAMYSSTLSTISGGGRGAGALGRS